MLAALVVFASCGASDSGSNTKPTPAPTTAAVVVAPVKAAPKFVIIEHKNAAFGGDVPSWVTAEIVDLESLPENKEKYVFIFDGTGENLEGTKLKVNNLNGASEIARYISLRVQAMFVGAQVGDDKTLATYMENIVKSLAQVEVQGFRKVSDYWVQRQFTDSGKTEYVYKVMYTIDKATVKQMLGQAADKQTTETPEKQTAKDRVKKIMEGNLPALAGS